MTVQANSSPQVLPPFRTVDEAQKEVVSFISRMHSAFDDELTDFAEQFVTRSHPELNEVLHAMMTGGSTVDALEETAEYQLFYAEISDVISHIIQMWAREWRGSIYGQIRWREAQRKRNMEGAPE